MDQQQQALNMSPVTDVGSVPPSLLGANPVAKGQMLALLYGVSHELTSTLDRANLLRLIAERVKKFVNYHVFSVMLWNEENQILESVFSVRYNDAIPSRLRMPLNQGITGIAAAERRTIRVNDVREDSRYLACDLDADAEVRSELVVPLMRQNSPDRRHRPRKQRSQRIHRGSGASPQYPGLLHGRGTRKFSPV